MSIYQLRHHHPNSSQGQMSPAGNAIISKQFSHSDSAMPREALRDWFPWALAVLVFISRVLVTQWVPYWADGPAHIAAIRSRHYVSGPPGYWLFNRLAGFFRDPQTAIQVINWSCSAVGCVAIYLCARVFVDKLTARLAAVVYGSVYFTWFAAAVQSTYATEMLFPPLLFLCLVCHYRTKEFLWLLGAGLSYALAAGFRPSDGLFIAIMALSYVVFEVRVRQIAVVITTTAGLCLVWFIPTFCGLHEKAALNPVTLVVSPLFNGLNYRTVANMVRFFLPLVTAFWLLVPALARTVRYLREREIQLLWLWVLPGSLFLILIYMSNSQYMTFLTGALVLLSAIGCGRSHSRLVSRRVLAVVAVWNICLFLLFTPLHSKSFAAKVVNVYVGQDTLHGLRHRLFQNLSDIADRSKPF